MPLSKVVGQQEAMTGSGKRAAAAGARAPSERERERARGRCKRASRAHDREQHAHAKGTVSAASHMMLHRTNCTGTEVRVAQQPRARVLGMRDARARGQSGESNARAREERRGAQCSCYLAHAAAPHTALIFTHRWHTNGREAAGADASGRADHRGAPPV